MEARKTVAVLLGCLLAGGVLLGQGPRRNVGETVPLPPNRPSPVDERAPAPAPQSTLSLDVDLVAIDVVVNDKSGGLVEGLDKSHFRVFDGDTEQTISNFTPTQAPLTAVVLIEFAQTFGYYYDNVLQPAAEFTSSLREEDWAALITYDMGTQILTDFTRNKNDVIGQLSRLQFPSSRETNLFDAVYDTLRRLDRVDGKKAIFLLSSGINTFSQRSLGEVLKKAETSDTMIYAASLGQFARLYYQNQIGQADNLEFLSADNNIRAMAEATGGMAFYPRFASEYPDINARISREMRNQYSIGFVPKNVKRDGKFHKLRVEVAKMDINGDGKLDTLTARHRKGYYAPKD